MHPQNMTDQQARTQGLHHLGLTVTNVDAAADFFVRVLGFQAVAERPDYPARFVSDGTAVLTLWQAQADNPIPFDRKRGLGLHHFALKLAPGQSLEELQKRLRDEPEVEVEFDPEPMGGGPARHMMFTIPGGPRMEIVAAAP